MQSFNDHLTEAFIDPFATAAVHVAGPDGVKGKWNVTVSYDTLKAPSAGFDVRRLRSGHQLVATGLDRNAAKKLRQKLNSDKKAMAAALAKKSINEAKQAPKGQLYVVIGTNINLSQDRVGGDFSENPTETEIALFSSEKLAKTWIKKNTLSKPKVMFGGEELPFRGKTLLGFYNSAEVESYQKPLPLPLDPK